jgi:hypothetical protein
MYNCKMARKVFVSDSYLSYIPGSNTFFSLNEALQQFDGSPLEIRLGDGAYKTGFLEENPDDNSDEEDDISPDFLGSIFGFKHNFTGFVGGGAFQGLQLDGKNRWNGLRIVTPEVEVTYTPYGYSVVVLDALQTVGESAFFGCTNLASIVFPDALQTIEKWAFFGCSSLTRVVFPDALQNIRRAAFWGCSSLTSVSTASPSSSAAATFPGVGLQTIERSAFSGCSSLASVDLSATNVQTIGFRAFFGCSSLVRLVFPDALQTIGRSAFFECSSLASVAFPDALQTITNSAFFECSSLVRVVFPDALQTIEPAAFKGCSSLTSVVFPDALQNIREFSFFGCTSLVSVVFPDRLHTIGDSAFSGCSSLASASVSSMTAMQTQSFPETCVVTIRQYKPVIPDQDGNCVICFNPLHNNIENGYLVKLACGHIFHRTCILKWQAENEFRTYVNYISFPICPLCRKPSTQLGSDGIYRLINLRF